MQSGTSSVQITGATVGNNLIVQSLSAGSGSSAICGSTINGNVTLQNDGGAIELGDGTAACPANTITGNATIQNNSGAMKVFSNNIDKNLICQSNSSITGAGNIAKQKQGQCSAF